MPSRSRIDEELDFEAGSYEWLFLAMFFALGGVFLIASGVLGLGLGTVFLDPVGAALVGGVVVLVPVSIAFVYARREQRRSLDRLEGDVAARLASLEEQAGELVALLSGHSRVLSRFHERALSSHAFQEEAQDRMEASHERQEARLMALERRLDEARIEDVHERLSALLARQEALFALVSEGEGSPSGEEPAPAWSPSPGGDGEPSMQPASEPVSTYPVEEVPGVGVDDARALARNGVHVTDTLVYADPSVLSKSSGIERERLEGWMRTAEMMSMVEPVDPEVAKAMVERGIGSLEALARLEVDELVDALEGSAVQASGRSLARRCEAILEEARCFREEPISEQASA